MILVIIKAHTNLTKTVPTNKKVSWKHSITFLYQFSVLHVMLSDSVQGKLNTLYLF